MKTFSKAELIKDYNELDDRCYENSFKKELAAKYNTSKKIKDIQVAILEELRNVRSHSIVFDNDGFNEANRQNGLEQIVSDPDRVKWFTNMLDEAGYFIELSDSLSLIKNTNNGV